MGRVYFKHVRLYDGLRRLLSNGGITIAVDEETNKINASYCSYKDKYCKSVGAGLAKQRLEEQEDDCTFYVWALATMRAIKNNAKVVFPLVAKTRKGEVIATFLRNINGDINLVVGE